MYQRQCLRITLVTYSEKKYIKLDMMFSQLCLMCENAVEFDTER